jgi:hypothetical protein
MRKALRLTEPDTVEIVTDQWYDPDPAGLGSERRTCYYSVTQGYQLSCDRAPNPDWKFGYYWYLPYQWHLENGQEILMSGQPFSVSGPHSGHTAFGRPVEYWRLANKNRMLIYDDGWITQYIPVGAAKLSYDAGPTRLLLHRDFFRQVYRLDDPYATVQYIEDLTSSNAFSGPADLSGGAEQDAPVATHEDVSSPLLGPLPSW